MNRRCRWPRGCSQPVSLVPTEGRDDGTCWYHWKVLHVRMHPHAPAFMRATIDSASVWSDERLDLVEALKALGASEERATELAAPAGRERQVPWGRKAGDWWGPRAVGLRKRPGEAGL